MHPLISIIAILGVTIKALALPMDSALGSPLQVENKEVSKRSFSEDNVFDDGAGCQLYKEPNLGGGDVVPRDTTFIPGNDFCTNLNNIYGVWDGKVRSFKVYSEYNCKFFTKYNCPKNETILNIEAGTKGESVVVNELSEEWDGYIHSVICRKI